MMELTIEGQVYQFNAGMGFVRKIEKKMQVPIKGAPGKMQDIGLSYMLGGIIDGDPDALVEVLDYMNEGQEPRITKNALDKYLEDEDTDIDALFEKVINFLSSANCTKKKVQTFLEEVEKEKERERAQIQNQQMQAAQ